MNPPPSSTNTPWDIILAASELPPPGPDHYVARRKLWLTPQRIVEHPSNQPSTSRQRLEKLLSFPDAAESDKVWNNGVENVWRGLNEGGRLKRRLPMALIVCSYSLESSTVFMHVMKIKIVHAAWIRENTWPPGAVAPEPDDILLNNESPSDLPQSYPPFPAHAAEYSYGVLGDDQSGRHKEETASGTAGC